MILKKFLCLVLITSINKQAYVYIVQLPFEWTLLSFTSLIYQFNCFKYFLIWFPSGFFFTLIIIASICIALHDGQVCVLIFVCFLLDPAAPGIISASPYGGAHAFPPAFAIQQTAGQYTNFLSPYYSIYNETCIPSPNICLLCTNLPWHQHSSYIFYILLSKPFSKQ